MPTHVTHVRTNAKVGANVAIGPKTIIVGPNGSGKSTIINAVELALTGRVSDIAGREDVAREADVMQLAPGDANLFAEVEFDDGSSATYTVEGSTAKAKKAVVKRPLGTDPDSALPIRTLKEALLGSPVTARKYLLGKAAGAVTREDVEQLIALPVRDLWQQGLAALPASMSAPDALVAVLELAGKQQREATAQAKTQREAGKLVGGGRVSPPTASELAAAKAELDAVRARHQAAGAAAGAFERLQQLGTQRQAATAEAHRLIEAHAFLASELANLPEAASHPVLPHVCEVMRASLSEAGGECLTCGTGRVSAELLAEVESAISGARETEARRAKLARDVQTARIVAERAVSTAEALDAEAERLSIQSEPLGDAVQDTGPALAAAEARYFDLKATADAWAKVRATEAAAIEAETASERWSQLKSSCAEAVAVVLDKSLAAFCAAVQSHLPPTDVFDLRLRDGDREVVQLGLVRDGRLHTALSGAEWARVVAAMASATAGDGLAVLIPEERAFDAKTLTAVLRAFSSCPQQVILASPVAPAGRLPAGWTLVETGTAA